MACVSCIAQLDFISRLKESILSVQGKLQDLLGNLNEESQDSSIGTETPMIEEEGDDPYHFHDDCSDSIEEATECSKSMTSNRTPQNKDITCGLCNRPFSTKANLLAHQITHIPLDQREKNHICHMCPKSFHNVGSLKQHLKTHDRTISQPCSICEKHVFDLPRHMKTMHEKRKTYTCNICGIQVARLGMHMKDKHAESQVIYSCSVCGKGFKTRTKLVEHSNIHTGIKVACPFCPHQSSSKRNLITHIKGQHPSQFESYKLQQIKAPKVKER